MPRRTRKLLIAVRSSVMCRALIPTPPVTSRFGSVKVGGSLGGADGAWSVGGESDTGLVSSWRKSGGSMLLLRAIKSAGDDALVAASLSPASRAEENRNGGESDAKPSPLPLSQREREDRSTLPAPRPFFAE